MLRSRFLILLQGQNAFQGGRVERLVLILNEFEKLCLSSANVLAWGLSMLNRHTKNTKLFFRSGIPSQLNYSSQFPFHFNEHCGHVTITLGSCQPVRQETVLSLTSFSRAVRFVVTSFRSWIVMINCLAPSKVKHQNSPQSVTDQCRRKCIRTYSV